MGIGQKLKETFSGDHSDRKHYDDSSTPGSFPSDGNGVQYHPPTGTAVGGHGTSSTYGRAEDDRAGGYGTSGHGTTGHGTSSAERRVEDRNVMDPADTKHGSNVMDSTGAAGNPLSGSSARDHHNKLHKAEDPRRNEHSGTSTDVGTGTAGLGSSHIPERQHHAGQDTTGYGRDSQDNSVGRTGYDGQTPGQASHTTGLGRDTYSSYDNDRRSTSSATDRGHGVYNTVTGTGSHEDPTQTHHHQGHQGQHDHRDRKAVPGTTTTGLGSHEHQGGTVQHARDTMDPRTIGTGTGSHHGQHEGRYRGGDTTDSRNTGTGFGSQDMAYRPHDTTSTGTTSDRREHIAPSGDSLVLGGSHDDSHGHSHGGSGLAGAGVSTGAAGIAAHEAGKHQSRQHGQQSGQYGDTGRSGYDNPSDALGQRSYDIGNTNNTGAPSGFGTSGGTDALRSSYNNSGRTTDSASQGYNQGYNQGHGSGQDHHGGAQNRAIDSIRSQQQERGVDAPVSSGAGSGQTDGSHSGQHGAVAGQAPGSEFGHSGAGSGLSSGTGSGQYRTPPDGAKVLHQCTHCGRDNDISEYFKKEVVYRLGQ